MATVDVLDAKGKKVGTHELSPEVFEAEIRPALMHQVVVAMLAARRAGTHATKSRGQVRGGGAKPWRQKGTGRARAGSIRAPQWTGGGVAMGPIPRDHAKRLPKRMKRAALRSALTARAGEGRVTVLDELGFDAPSTKEAVGLLESLGAADDKVLIVIAAPDEILEKSFRNLRHVRVTYGSSLSTYEVLQADRLVFTKDAIGLAGSIRAADDHEAEDAATASEGAGR